MLARAEATYVGRDPAARDAAGDGARRVRARVRRPGALMPNAVLGTLVFLGAETMVFGGLVSALLVLRAGNAPWPPSDQPRLPIAVTAVNTLVLVLSGVAMARAADAARRGRVGAAGRPLAVAAALGATFLVVQGVEWIRLLRYGLSATTSTYGGTFYTLIGCHALHVLGGLILLLVVLRGVLRGRYAAGAATVEACRLYWSFVVGVWPLLYVLVYLL